MNSVIDNIIDCLDAIIQYENEEYDEEDELTPIDKRYQLNKYI